MEIVSNSLTNFLDQRLHTIDEIERFIDDLEDEIFGIPHRDFYLIYKGDVKELLYSSENTLDDLSFESELLAAFIRYYNQRKESNR